MPRRNRQRQKPGHVMPLNKEIQNEALKVPVGHTFVVNGVQFIRGKKGKHKRDKQPKLKQFKAL